MLKNVLLVFLALFLGLCGGYFGIRLIKTTIPQNSAPIRKIASTLGQQRQVIGFMPYWLIDKVDKDYTQYLTTLTYFGITIGTDGKIVKLANPQEKEPGWYALESGKMEEKFTQAKRNELQLSLTAFSGVPGDIDRLLDDPVSHADNFISDVAPLMKQYGFSDLNLDVESVAWASPSSQEKFTSFVREVKKQMDRQSLGTLSIDVSPTDLIKQRVINLSAIEPFVDSLILMTYDFHYSGSAVTGPVAPINGVETVAEYDTETSIKQALKVIPPGKIVLGAPLYGYEWETIFGEPRSAVIPGSGQVASNRRMEQFVASCASCSASFDPEAKETYLIYKDQGTDTFHQVFYPDKTATAEKISLVKKYQISGLAFWALGYDGETIMEPLAFYK